MSEDRPDRNSFEEVARALVEEMNRAVERLSEIDVDEIVRTARAEAERARRWVDDFAGSLREHGGDVGGVPFGGAEASQSTRDSADRRAGSPAPSQSPLPNAGPHPLDLPSADQGLALAALDSGRWRLEPGTSALAVHGDGPGPNDALGLVRELRVRDWMTVDGELTLAGRKALGRWLDC
jgi:hypothetical protein